MCPAGSSRREPAGSGWRRLPAAAARRPAARPAPPGEPPRPWRRSGGPSWGRPGAPQGARLQAAPLRALRGAEGAAAAKPGAATAPRGEGGRGARGSGVCRRGGGGGRPPAQATEVREGGREREGGVGGAAGLSAPSARLRGGGGRQQVRGWPRSPGKEGGGAGPEVRGEPGSWGRRRRAAPGPRGASEGHPRAPPLVVHRSLRQGPGGPRRELFSPASLRGVREITEADLYTIQFIAWKEEGGWGGEMPLVPPRPLRPRKTTIHRPWVRVS